MTATAARAAFAGALLLPSPRRPRRSGPPAALEAPESVLLDGRRDILYVANIAGDPVGKDGNGYLSILGPDGSVSIERWVTGLDAPKGLVLDGDTLYVTDIDRLVAIDVAEGTVAGTWPAEGAMFLNDTAVDDAGRVFVSDMLTDRIYLLEDGTLSVWLEDAALEHPNGLAIAGRPARRRDLGTRAQGGLHHRGARPPADRRPRNQGDRAVRVGRRHRQPRRARARRRRRLDRHRLDRRRA